MRSSRRRFLKQLGSVASTLAGSQVLSGCLGESSSDGGTPPSGSTPNTAISATAPATPAASTVDPVPQAPAPSAAPAEPAGLSWAGFNSLTLRPGDRFDLKLLVRDSSGQPLQFAYVPGPGLPAGVSLSADGILTVALTAQEGTSTPHRIQASTGPAAPSNTPPAVPGTGGLIYAGFTPSPTATWSGRSRQIGYGKHNTFRYCPWDKCMWQYGGDNGGPWFTDGDVMTVARYNAANGAWEEMYPFYGVAGREFPGYRGNNQLVWDSRRQLFWSACGDETGTFWRGLVPNYVGTIANGYVYQFDPKVPVANRYVKGIAKDGVRTFPEGYGGDYDATRDRIYWVKGAWLCYLQCHDDPMQATFGHIPLSGARTEAAASYYFDQSIDATTDEIYWFWGGNVGGAGQILATKLGTGMTRIVARPPHVEWPGRDPWENQETPIVWVPSRRQLVMFYFGLTISGGADANANGAIRIVSVDTGQVTNGPNLPAGVAVHNTAAYDPHNDLIVSVGVGAYYGNPEGAKQHHWKWAS